MTGKRQKILVTGAGGFVAGSVITQAPRDWTVLLVLRRNPSRARSNWTWCRADASEPESLGPVILETRPHAVIHAAAIPNIDYCESHPDEALRVNTEATRVVAEACARAGAKLVFCSTDNVFDGQRGWSREGDMPNPVNHYGRTKYLAEQAIDDVKGLRAVIARFTLVMGMPLLGSGRPFMARALEDLASGGPVWAPPGEIRSPIDVISLGRALLELSENDFTGRIHLAGSDRVDRVELTRRIVHWLGQDPERVRPVDIEAVPGRARRPLDVTLDSSLARSILRTPLPGIERGFHLVMTAWERVRAGDEPEAYVPCGS
ncbi:MAG TPA: NAD(P)-dependent oxidoreductase [Candidatus Hydrogenedentes bacterium]|nr:NAD(P)-dependent oxidoreductase [Candidatus Hydrogenedentota bacterium]